MHMHLHSRKTAVAAALVSIGLASAAPAQQPQQGMQPNSPVPQPQAQPAPAAARRPVSLAEALAIASKSGPDVIAARAQAAVAAVGIERFWTAWKPDITATGTFDHTSAPQTFDEAALVQGLAQTFQIPIPPGTVLPAPITIVGANSLYGAAQISQPLFSPQGLFLKKPAELNAEAAQRGADDAREQVLLGVARAYLGLQGLEGLLQAAKDAEQVALRRENDAKVQINAGTAVEIALLRAQTETANARAQIAALEGQKESLLALLEGAVGESISAQPAGAATNLGEAGDEGQSPWEQTFSVQSAIAQVKAAESLVHYDKWLWLPRLDALAKGNYNSNAGFAGTKTTYDLIVNLSIPIYDRGQRYVTKHEDEAKLGQAQAALASARAKARSSWAGARANLVAAQAVLAQSESQAVLARRTQQQVEVSAKAGVATNLDLSDADNRRFQAESSAAQAKATLEVRRAEIAAAEGRLFRAAAPAQ
jgi:outer membrane protein TolC